MDPNTTSAIGQFIQGPGIMILLVVVFVVLIILPQRKRDKKVKDMLAAVKVGDHVRTIGGIYGRIVQLKESTMTIEVGPDKVKLVFARGAISTVGDENDVENTMTEEVK